MIRSTLFLLIYGSGVLYLLQLCYVNWSETGLTHTGYLLLICRKVCCWHHSAIFPLCNDETIWTAFVIIIGLFKWVGGPCERISGWMSSRTSTTDNLQNNEQARGRWFFKEGGGGGGGGGGLHCVKVRVPISWFLPPPFMAKTSFFKTFDKFNLLQFLNDDDELLTIFSQYLKWSFGMVCYTIFKSKKHASPNNTQLVSMEGVFLQT